MASSLPGLQIVSHVRKKVIIPNNLCAKQFVTQYFFPQDARRQFTKKGQSFQWRSKVYNVRIFSDNFLG
jgi:hypothetical protein